MPINPEDILNQDIASGQLPAAGDQFAPQEPVAPMLNINNVLPVNNPGFESKLSQSSLGLSASDQMLLANEADREMMKMIEAGYPVGETGNLGESTYFPGMQDPILKAYSSSKTLGSQPIFVRSGGAIPYGITDARKKALQDAAIIKANQQRAFTQPKKPLTKDPRFQEKVNEKFDTILSNRMSEARGLYGDKYLQMLQNPNSEVGKKMVQDLDNLDVLARETDQVTDLIGKIEADKLEGKGAVSDQTNKLVQDYYKLVGDFEKGEAKGSIRENLNKLYASRNADDYLHKTIFPDLEYQVTEAMGAYGDKGDFYEQQKRRTETIKNVSRKIAEGLKAKGGYYAHDDLYTVEDLQSRIENMMPDKVERESSTVGKPSGGSGYDYMDASEVNVQDHKYVNIGNEQVIGKNLVDLKTRKNAEPWNVTGGTFIGEDGTERVLKGVSQFIPVTMGDFDVPVTNEKGEKATSSKRGITGFIIEKKQVQINDPETGTMKTIFQDVKTPVILEEHGQEAKFKTEVPISYGVFNKSSELKSRDAGVKSTAIIMTGPGGTFETTEENRAEFEKNGYKIKK